jgi:hypothetical protein
MSPFVAPEQHEAMAAEFLRRARAAQAAAMRDRAQAAMLEAYADACYEDAASCREAAAQARRGRLR